MKPTATWIISLCVLSISAQENNLAPFTSDGCSLFPDGSFNNTKRWAHCCHAHDIDYWQGGTKAQRLTSDKRLEQCVSDAGLPGLGQLMFLGVRLGGIPMAPTSFRWGYGWSENPGYRVLTMNEIKQVERLTPSN